jgi:hypothetical protein
MTSRAMIATRGMRVMFHRVGEAQPQGGCTGKDLRRMVTRRAADGQPPAALPPQAATYGRAA